MLHITNNIIQITDFLLFCAMFQTIIKEIINRIIISIAIFIKYCKKAIFILFLLFVFPFHNNSYLKVM